jgi:hypothetical protein
MPGLVSSSHRVIECTSQHDGSVQDVCIRIVNKFTTMLDKVHLEAVRFFATLSQRTRHVPFWESNIVATPLGFA